MAIVNVGLFGTQTINTSSTDLVSFAGAGTLNIVGAPGSPIDVTLSQVAGVGLLDTINITNANVTLAGVAGVAALVAYNIGSGGQLTLASTVGVSAGTLVTFTAPSSHLVLGNGVDVSVLGGIAGFAPGSNIDVSALASSFTYADAPGTNTGGVITLLNASGGPVGVLALTTGEYTPGSFAITPDATGGTLVGFSTTVTGITASPATADLGAGKVVTLAVSTSDPVTVVGGTPTLLLNDGGIAAYNVAASTPKSLVFSYTVAPGQNTPDLAVMAANLNGASITNASGIPVSLSPAVVNPAGVLQIDTTAPVVNGVTTSPGSGDLGIGRPIAITVGTTKPVTVAGGTPTLTLSDGGTAAYSPAASTPTALVFTTTVAPGQNTPDLAVTAVNPNGATVADAVGNLADLSGAVTNPPGVLQINTTAPMVNGVTTSPGSGDLGIGRPIAITVGTTKPVTVAGGTPTLTLSDGGTAAYSPGASTPMALVFTTTVAPGQNTPDLAVTAVNPNGATVADAAGNPADLSGAVTNPPGVLQIDTTAPMVNGVTTSPGSGDLGIGRPIAITVGTTKPVTVAGGTPTLTLSDGGTAAYSPGASTPTALVFTTTVAPGQNTPDLAVTAVNPNGATVADAAGNPADLSGAVTNPPGVLQVDTTAPVVNGVTTSPGSGDLGIGQPIAITVGTTKPVTVANGTPTLLLSDGGTAAYNPGASTPTALVFTTTVAPGQSTPDLAVTAVNPNGATVADAAGNPADLSGAVTNPPGVLQVDTTAPAVTGVTTMPGSGIVGLGQPVAILVGTSKPVGVTGGTPTLSLSDGGTAAYTPAASTPTGLMFTYMPNAGDSASDLAVTGLNLNGATIADAAGNALNGSGAAVNPPGVLQVVTGFHPFTTLVASDPDPAAVLTLTAVLAPTIAGTFSNLGGGRIGADGNTYTVSGTAAAVNAALTGVLLTPTGTSSAVAGVTATIGDASTATTSRLSDTGALAVDMTVTTAGDVLAAGLGADTLRAGAAGNLLIGGPGNDVLVGNAGGSTLTGGTGNSVIFGVGGSTRITGGSTFDVIVAIAGTESITTSSSGTSLVALGTSNAVLDSRGADVVFGGSGPEQITTAKASLIGLGSGAAGVTAANGTIVIGGSGPDTINVSSGGVVFFAGSGPSTFLGSGGTSIVVGGAGGGQMIQAGSGGGLFGSGAGGNNTVVGGQAGTTILGGAGGDVLYAEGAAGTLIAAGFGNETLVGAGSSGNDTFIAGGGTTTITLGSGQDNVIAGAGSASVTGGSGAETYSFAKGSAGTMVISGFKVGTDHLGLSGYGAGEAAHAVATAQSGVAGTVLTLSDNTRITLVGFGGVDGRVFG